MFLGKKSVSLLFSEEIGVASFFRPNRVDVDAAAPTLIVTEASLVADAPTQNPVHCGRAGWICGAASVSRAGRTRFGLS
jgi:hypothetical protein